MRASVQPGRLLTFLVPLGLAVASLYPVELSFALTSFALADLNLRWLFPQWLAGFMYALDTVSWDWRCLELLCASGALMLFAFRKAGAWRALFRTVAALSAALIPLPVEIYLFNRGDFDLHFAMALYGSPLIWFTNADLLGFSVLFLAVALSALSGPGLRVGSSRRRALIFLGVVLLVVAVTGAVMASGYVPPACVCQAGHPGGITSR